MPSLSASARRPWRTAAEALLWVAVFGCPLARGGVDPAVFFALAVVAALALAFESRACRREGLPVPSAALGLAGGALLALLSALPLPAFVTGLLSHRAVALASLPPEPARSFVAWSLDPPASLVDAVRLAALAAVLVTAAALARQERNARRLAAAVALAGLAVTLASVARFLAHASTFFGLFSIGHQEILPTTFINQNHSASFFILATVASIGLFRVAHTHLERFGWGAAATANGALALTSLSRGGIAALVIACALIVWLADRRARLSRGSRSPFGVVMIVGLVFSAALLVGVERFLAPWRKSPEAAVDKMAVWPATLRLIRDHWLTGVGRGAYSPAFSAYVPPGIHATFTHPENLLLQWMAEWGVPVALAGLFLLGWTLWRAYRRPASQDHPLVPLCDALFAGLVAVLLHDLADFGLEFAGVGVPFAVLLGVLAGQSAGPTRLHERGALAFAGAVALVFLPLGISASHRLVDGQLARVARETKGAGPQRLDAAYRRVRATHPADPFVDVTAADRLLDLGLDPRLPLGERSDAVRRALPFLARAQSLWMSDEPHLLTARALWLIGRRPQAFTELRQALRIGGNTGAVVNEALRIGATPRDLASLPEALSSSWPGAPVAPLFTPATGAAAVVFDLWAGHHLWRLSRQTAAVLVADQTAPWATDRKFLVGACTAGAIDGNSVGQPQASTKDELPAISKLLGSIADRLTAVAPSDSARYVCAADAARFEGDQARADRWLQAGVAAIPSDVSLRLMWARRLLASNQPEQAVSALRGITDPAAGNLVRQVRELRVAALHAAGRVRRAEAEAQDVVDAHYDQSWAHQLFASTLAQDGLYVRAAREAQVAARLTTGAQRVQLEGWRKALLLKARQELPPTQPVP